MLLPIVCKKGSEEEKLQFLLDALEKLNYIETRSYSGGEQDLKITKEGWTRIKELENKTPNANSKTAFIAMWFDKSTNTLNKEIQKGIRQAGYTPLRIDEEEHNNKIDDQILSRDRSNLILLCVT